jgi:hypothetical protein
MTRSRPQARAEAAPGLDGESWLMRRLRVLPFGARRRMLSPDELSPHLLRDIGLEDGLTARGALQLQRRR